ncbi:hypothetical protein JCGZ_01363 [Jatropha curcas]|uniref:Homeobox domain-containing protein n=1 Tax=Jatropha curcas TaxID=180498 RepID=A0A067LCA5_JATCU|nr:BEL1-like homeodomain protein 9 [Jatropha curcas]KDP44863.1 hypothetical protein JCGZ_01363 [Jatropha curcas]
MNPSFQNPKDLSLSLSFQLESQRYNDNSSNVVSIFGDCLKQNSNNNGGIRSSVPLGPFTGYASILKSSRFLKPAQQILDDLCGSVNYEVFDFSWDFLRQSEVMRESVAFSDRAEHGWKNSKLTFMLDEVYRRYKLYCQQMESVVASFETVAGLGNAAPFVCYAIKLMSKHFSFLKNVLLDQIHFTGKISDDGNINNTTNEKFPRFCAVDEHGLQNQNPSLNLSFLQHPVWRSQRGLPDHAVAVLKTWLFEHFLHPYPNDSEKQILAQQTGLSRTQVSNWFINARVRLWKPMVEEVYKLSSQQAQVPLEAVNTNVTEPSDFSFQKLPQTTYDHSPSKRSRNELADVSVQSQYQASNGIGVSLALGLHDSNGIDLSSPFPVNMEMVRMMDSTTANFEAQNQHFPFGKD